jgi:acetamidase/formamidase
VAFKLHARDLAMVTRHEIPPSPESMVWGYLDAETPPVLEVESGDIVTLHSFPAGGYDVLPPDRSVVDPDYLAALATMPPGPGPHFITVPVYVRGARPGATLQVDILDVQIRQDWGFVLLLPLAGTLIDEFQEFEAIHPRIDRQRGIATMPWGTEIPLDPFFGILATAPPPRWGRCGSPVPRAFGGNMDNKELTQGTTVYFPVFVPGALFSAGDGHAIQGDGEVCLTAIETALTGTFELNLQKGAPLRLPRAEKPDAWITMAFDEDLDDAVKLALREMIQLIVEKTGLSRQDAYTLCSIAADLRVTQMVDGNKGIHCVLPKAKMPGRSQA